MRRTFFPCVLAAALMVGGCGTGGDRDEARDAAQALYRAVDRHDGAAACAQLGRALRAQLAEDEGEPCRKAVLDLELSGKTPDHVAVYADEAMVRMAGGDTVFLSVTRQGWRVDAFGCKPAGKGPYDCEAES